MTLGFCCSHHFTWPRVVKLSISTGKQGYYIDKTYRIIFILQRKKGAVMSGFVSFLSVLLTVLVVDYISVLLFNHYVPITSNHIHCLPSICVSVRWSCWYCTCKDCIVRGNSSKRYFLELNQATVNHLPKERMSYL